MGGWTPEGVAWRFEECVATLRKLPGDCGPGMARFWPPILYTPRELARQAPVPLKVLATPDEITRMEETLTWVVRVSLVERHLLWLRAHRMSWRAIARETGFPRSSAQRVWEGALERIAGQLNQGEKRQSFVKIL